MAADGLLSDADVGITDMAPSVPPIFTLPQKPAQPAPATAVPAAGAVPDLTVTRAPTAASTLLSDADVGIVPTLSLAGDVAKSTGSGFVRGLVAAPFAAASMAKTGADAIVNAGDWAVRKALGLGDASPEWQAKQAKAAEAIQADQVSPYQDPLAVGAGAQQALTPYLHTPQTKAGEFAQAVGEFAPIVAANPAGLATLGTAAGASRTLAGHVIAPALASEGAGQLADANAPQYADLARLAGGIGGGIAAHGLGAAASAAGTAAINNPAVAKAVSMTPGLGGVGRGLQENIAAREIANRATNLPTLTQAASATPTYFDPTKPVGLGDEVVSAPGANHAIKPSTVTKVDPDAGVAYVDNRKKPIPLAELQHSGAPNSFGAVPGFQPTSYQAFGDQGLGAFERAASRSDQFQGAYLQRQGQQQAAQRTATGDLLPAGDPTAASTFVQDQLDAIHAAADARIGDAMANAQTLGAAIDGSTPEVSGADLQGRLAAANAQAEAHERALWKAVNPDGTLAYATHPVTDAYQQVYGNLPRASKAALTPYEQQLGSIIGDFGPVESFDELTALRRELAGAMRQERAPGGSPTAYARLSSLMGPLQDTISNIVDRHSASERHDVAAGQRDLGNTLENRLRGYREQQQRQQAEAHAGAELGTRAVGNAAGGSAGLSPISGAGGQGDLRPGAVARAQAIPRDEPGASPEGGPGAVRTVYHPAGSLQVRNEVAEHSSLITSHDADFRPRPDFPVQLQPRARDSAGARDQVNGMAAHLQPERLGPSPEANSGAPIVGPDGVVESGNGRTLAIGKAYDAGRGGPYRAHLESLGYDTRGMDRPVLVGRRVSPMTPEQREAFTGGANDATALRMGSAEQAAADAGKITPAMLDSQASSDVAAAANRPFVSSFMSKLPAAERGALVDKAGNLSAAGVRRIQGAMVAHAYGDGGLLSRAFDDADPNVKGMVGALTDAAGPWAKMRAAARDGTIAAEHDVTPELMQGVKLAMRARDEGRPIGELLRQRNLFDPDTSKLVTSMLTKDGERLATRPQIEANLRAYAEEALKNEAGARLFGESSSVSDVLRASQERAARETGSEPSSLPDSPAFADVTPPRQATADAAAGTRLRAASAATKERVKTFEEGPVGDILAPGSRKGEFATPASAVPSKVFRNGPAGYDAVKAYFKAAGTAPETVAAVEHGFNSLLREKAISGDGTVRPAGLAELKQRLGHALRAIDEVSPGFSSKFDDAGRATQALMDATKNRLAEAIAYKRRAVGKLLGVSSDEGVVNRVGKMITADDGVEQVRELMHDTAGDAAANAGARAAVGRWFVNRITSDLEAGTTGERVLQGRTFGRLLGKYRGPMREALTPEQMDAAGRIAETFDQVQRSLTGSKVGFGSDTAQNSANKFFRVRDEASHGPGGLMFVAAEGAGAGYERGGLKGAAAGLIPAAAGAVWRSVRDAGMRDVRSIVNDALMNPARLRQLLGKLPEAGSRADKEAAGALRRSYLMSAADEDRRQAERAEPTMSPDPRWNASSRPAAPVQPAPAGRVEPTLRPAARAPDEVLPSRRAVDAGDLPHPTHDDRSADGRFATNTDTEGALRGALNAARDDVLAGLRSSSSDVASPVAKADVRRTVDLPLGGKRSMTLRALDRELADRTMALAAMDKDPSQITYPGRDAVHREQIATLNEARAKFDPDYKPDLGRFSPAKIMDAGADHVVSVATDERHGATPDSKTFKIFPRPETETARARDLGRPLGQVDLRRHGDGRWEVSMVEVTPRARGQGVATALYGAVQKELGVEMSPSGLLLPDGYAFWQKRDPAKVQYHQPFAGTNGTVYYSPKRVSQLLENPRDAVRAAELRTAFDALPPEAKSPAALDAMFSQHRASAGPDAGQPIMDPADSFLRNPNTGEAARVQSTAPLGDMLARYAATNDVAADPLMRAAAQAVGGRVSKLIGDMPVHVVDRDAMRALAQGQVTMQRGFEPGGFYDRRAGHIVALDEAMRDPREAASLMLHEGLHGALQHVISGSEGMRTLINHVRLTARSMHIENGGEPHDHYGFENAHEFISEANSNPQFQALLKSLPADERLVRSLGLDGLSKPTMWSTFVETVRKVFGLAPGQRTYLDAALRATDHLFNQAEAVPRAPAGASARPVAPQPPGPGLTDRATALMPAMRAKFGETIGAAAASTAEGFGDAMAASPHMPILLGSALAPRWNANDAGYQRAWQAMEARGLFSPDETKLLQREAPRMAAAVRRSFPTFDAAAASPAELRGAAFAHFANGREEEGMEGSHFHIGVRRAFERIYQAMQGVQAAGNRVGLYRPSDVRRPTDAQNIAGLAPNIPGEAMRAQHL